MNALRVEGLSYSYPDGHEALFDVNLDVAPGERVAVLGPNGAGKTTLMLHLNGVLMPAVGSVQVDEVHVERGTLRAIREKVGLLFQDPDDQLFMPTVAEDVAFGPANFGLSGDALEARVVEALSMVGMQDAADRPPHHLSFGQRRRVALATVLAMHPGTLVLDEPSSNLDPAGRRELASILGELELTMLIVTHDLPYAAQLCHRAVVMNHGRVIADGPLEELLRDDALMAANRLELPPGFDVEGVLKSRSNPRTGPRWPSA